MPDLICSVCHADVEPDLLESTGAAVCPFCGADLAHLSAAFSASASRPAHSEAAGAPGDSLPRGASSAPALPPGSKLQVVEDSEERLVFYLPGGGKHARGLGFFALVWNGFMCVFTGIMGFAMIWGKGPRGRPGNLELLGMLAFDGLFWLIGLVLLGIWIKMKYERTFVLLDFQRVAIQRVLFGKKRIREFTLGPATQAVLAESYKQNNIPVYHVAIAGTNATAKFGTTLSDGEKTWLVNRINSFFGIATCPKCGTALVPADGAPDATSSASRICPTCSAVVDASGKLATSENPLRPESLQDDEMIRILDASPQHLRFRLPATTGLTRWVLSIFMMFAVCVPLVGMALVFQAGLGKADGPERFVFAVVVGLCLLAPLVPVGAGLLLISGKITVDLTPERLSCTWGVGEWGYTRSVPTASIDFVGTQVARSRRPRTTTPTELHLIGMVRAGTRFLPLTLLHAPDTARQVVALVRTRLADMGFTVPDA